jgi:hypothetical protein
MRRWVNVFRAHAVAHFEPCRRGRRSSIRAAPRDPLNIGQRESAALQALAGTEGVTGRQLVGFDNSVPNEQLHAAQKPSLIVGTGQVDIRRQQFNAVAIPIDIPHPEHPDRAGHRQHAPLPTVMKNRLVRLGLDLAKPVHTAHVVDAVH